MKQYHQSTFKLMSKILLIGIIFSLVKPYNGQAQVQTDEKKDHLERRANTQYGFGYTPESNLYDYTKALPLYLELLKYDSTSFLYNYRTGVSYLYSNTEITKSVNYFEAARKHKALTDGATFEFHYNMGLAYQLTNRFDEAIESFTIAKTFSNSNDSIVNQRMRQCETGKKLMEISSDARIFNLGKNVNSIYPDYLPLVLPNQSELIFTSARKGSTGGKTIEGGAGDDYYEDIYISKNTKIPASLKSQKSTDNQGPVFLPAKSIGPLINSKENDASTALSPDGGTLFMYRKTKMWESNIDNNGNFGKPKVFKSPVFSKADVASSLKLMEEQSDIIAPSLFFTNDGSTLYLVSSRPGGYGGKDIYKSVQQKDGNWGPAENLGPIINTSLDEESPFFDTDAQTLYFSSKGHNSIGGFDVFSSKLENKTWSQPENLGYPINSGADDWGYAYDEKENIGYYTTMREDGIGNFDIYMIRYMQPLKVSLLATYSGSLTPKNLKVKILGSEGKDSMKITVNQRNQVTYKPNKEYRLLIPRYNADSVLDTLHFKTPESLGGYTCLQEINYESVKNNRDLLIGYKTTVYNVFFNMEKEIEKSGARNTKVLLTVFPMCGAINPAYTYYSNDKLTKEEEYSKFVRTVKPDHKDFKIYSQTSYIDTSSFALIYKMQDSMTAAAVLENPKVTTVNPTPTAEKKAEQPKTKEATVVSTKPAEQPKEELKTTVKESKAVTKEKNISKNEKEEKKEAPKDKQQAVTEKKETTAKSEKTHYVAFSGGNGTTSTVFKSIYFELAKSDFDDKFKSELKEVIDYMKEKDNEHVLLEIRGYTDSLGTEKFNTALSEDRALAIKRMMVKDGVNAYRIKAVGMGEEEKSAAAASEKESKKAIEAGKTSRRVDFVIISKIKKHSKEKK